MWVAPSTLHVTEPTNFKLRSPGDADVDSPFSAASNPLYDEHLAAGHGSGLRSPHDGMFAEGTEQGGDVMQLRRCVLCVPPCLHLKRNFVLFRRATRSK